MDKNSSGFTLIELIVVIAILGILATISVSRFEGFKNMAEDSVCATNQKTVEKMYLAALAENRVDHEDNVFNQIIDKNFDEVCPAGGLINYEDGEVNCSMHDDRSENEEDDEPKEEVPWL